jgi:hypothetical protein
MQKMMTLCAALATTGCAVGYGVGHTSVRAAKTTDRPAAQTWSATYQEFRLIDTTGIALAGFVNMGRQYNARQEALREANRLAATAQPGETVRVDYSWEPMPILAGLLTDIRFRLPLGSASLDYDGNPSMLDVTYWGLNVRPEFYTFRPVKSLPLVSSLYLTADFELWKSYQPMAAATSVDDLFTIDIDFGASTSYVIGENLVGTGRVAIGTLSPIFALLTPNSSYVNPSLEAEVAYRPWHSEKMGVSISALGYLGREFVAGTKGTTAWNPRVGVTLAFTFGNQVPKKVRKAREQEQPPAGDTSGATATADPNAPLSGNVCLGSDPPPECNQVANKAPDRVKILWLACVQSTLKAAETKSIGTQPSDCRTAADGIAVAIKNGPGQPVTADDQRLMRVAAAGAYDLAAAGYEASTGRLSKEHCEAVESTFNFVVGPDPGHPVLPTKVKTVDAVVTMCRQKFVCSADAEGRATCDAKEAPAAAPATPPATPPPVAPSPATPPATPPAATPPATSPTTPPPAPAPAP